MLEPPQAGKYITPGGYTLYMNQMKHMENAYSYSCAKGCMKQSVLRNFLIEQEPRRCEILAADTELNEKAKKLAGWE